MSTLLSSSEETAAAVVPLIDVDCNLWHADLKSLQVQAPDNNNNDNDNDNGSSNNDFGSSFRLLHEDAVTESGIVAVLSPSSTLKEAKRGLARLEALSQQPTDVPAGLLIRTTVGIHPYHVQDEDVADQDVSDVIATMTELLLKDGSRWCAAVGECGLDASEGFPPLERQIPLFRAQVRLARDLQLPLFVHERLAFDTCLEILQQQGEVQAVPVIIHCFTGTKQECEKYIDHGYFISLSGYIFKAEAAEVRQSLRDAVIPLDRLMIETDAPYMGFAGCRTAYVAKNAAHVESLRSKQRKRLLNSLYPNVPSSLPQVLDLVLKEINTGRAQTGEVLLTREELARQTSRNANQFFGYGLDL